MFASPAAALVLLGERYAEALELSLSTTSLRCANQGRFLERLAAGKEVTAARANRITKWFSDNWPSGHAWPASIPRPTPTRDTAAAPTPKPDPLLSPAAARATVPAPVPRSEVDPVAGIRILNRRRVAALEANNWTAMREAEQAAIEAGSMLDPATGRVACPKALCLALGVPRSVYDDVVRRYAGDRRDDRPPRRARRGSRAERVLLALRAAGDRRFDSSPSTHLNPQEAA